MIITIQTEDGTLQYDVSKITDSNTRVQAKTLISKVGTLDVVSEALTYASATHRGSLETLLKANEDALVQVEEDDNEALSEA